MLYEIGDVVEIAYNFNGHGFEIGEKVKIVYVNYRGKDYEAESLEDESKFWFITDGEVIKKESGYNE